MSTIPLLPTYYYGVWQHHLDIAAGTVQYPGEYHCWTPDASPIATSHIFIVHKDSTREPHPSWVKLPHILKQDKIKSLLPDTHINALNAAGITIDGNDTVFDLVTKLHTKHPVFIP